MQGILTITLNPAVDLATSVDRVIPGPKLRCKPPRIDPGGGGVNVARAIFKLGGSATALVATGGITGQQLQTLLVAEGVAVHPVQVSGETRQSFAVTDEGTGAQYRFSVPGQVLTGADGARLLAEIAGAAPQDGYAVFSGSVAPGLADDFPGRMMAAIAPRTDRFIVDTSGAALSRLIATPGQPVHILRLDGSEAGVTAEPGPEALAQALAFADDAIGRGVARTVVVGSGARGSVMAGEGLRLFCHAPQVPVRSKIGAGDALVGAMTLALARGETPARALQWGVAASSATVMTEGTALCDAAVTQALLDSCRIEEL